MFKTELMTKLVNYLLENNIKLTIFYPTNIEKHEITSDEKVLFIDLNTYMKSDVYIYEYKGNVYADTRYKTGLRIENLHDLLDCASDAICGRDFMSYNWQVLLEKEGYIEIETKQTQTIKTL